MSKPSIFVGLGAVFALGVAVVFSVVGSRDVVEVEAVFSEAGFVAGRLSGEVVVQPVEVSEERVSLIGSLSLVEVDEVALAGSLPLRGELEALSGGGALEERGVLLERWAVLDGAEAMSYVLDSVADDALFLQMGRVLRGWASVDPRGARAWLLGYQKEEDARLWAFFFEGAVQFDVKLAETFLADLTRGVSRHLAARVLVRSHEEDGVGALTRWLDGMAGSPAHLDLVRWAARGAGERAPQELIPWVMGLPRAVRAVAVNGLVGRWALRRPGEAMDWAMSLGDASMRTDAAALVIDRWASVEPEVAGEWLLQHLDRMDLDRVVVRYSYRHQSYDPELAMTWASAIRDPLLRDETMGNLRQAFARVERM